ncbi:hypothetical protein [Vallitalea okinawensis]|uniref:hypothetical protein n=1 Tax=Vallitalea okinawensis TaxID=2078660 RepID=UPI000CFAB2DF|nr:hypothetical protein [Vallitalea okinawensis]
MSQLRVGIATSLFFITVILVINVLDIGWLWVNGSIAYAAEKEIEFIDEEFKKSIILQRNIDLPLDSERIWEPLSQEDINNMETVVIHEDFNPDTYEDIYLFPNVRRFVSWDLDMTMQQIIEVDRYVKSINLKGTVEFSLESMISNKEQSVIFSNSLTEEILKELDGTGNLNVEGMANLLFEGIKLKDSHFKGESQDQMVNVICDLISNDYVNLIDYSELNIDPIHIEQLESIDLVIGNGIIRKRAKYENETQISDMDLTDSTKWYNNGVMFLTENEDGEVIDNDKSTHTMRIVATFIQTLIHAITK